MDPDKHTHTPSLFGLVKSEEIELKNCSFLWKWLLNAYGVLLKGGDCVRVQQSVVTLQVLNKEDLLFSCMQQCNNYHLLCM